MSRKGYRSLSPEALEAIINQARRQGEERGRELERSEFAQSLLEDIGVDTRGGLVRLRVWLEGWDASAMAHGYGPTACRAWKNDVAALIGLLDHLEQERGIPF
jgi:hypothetical protein